MKSEKDFYLKVLILTHRFPSDFLLNNPEFPVSESKSIDWQMFYPAEIQEKERIFLNGFSVRLKIRQCFVSPILFQILQAQTSNHHLELMM